MTNDLPGINDCAECLAPRPSELPAMPEHMVWFCSRSCAETYFYRDEAWLKLWRKAMIGDSLA